MIMPQIHQKKNWIDVRKDGYELQKKVKENDPRKSTSTTIIDEYAC